MSARHDFFAQNIRNLAVRSKDIAHLAFANSSRARDIKWQFGISIKRFRQHVQKPLQRINRIAMCKQVNRIIPSALIRISINFDNDFAVIGQ